MSQIIIKNLINFKTPPLHLTSAILISKKRTITYLNTSSPKNSCTNIEPAKTLSELSTIGHLKPLNLNSHYNLISNNNNTRIDINHAKENNPINTAIKQEKDKASLEQLIFLEKQLQFELPKFFVSSHNLTLYSKDLVFIDNITGVRIKGLVQYLIRLNLIKAYYAIQYSSTKLELLNLVKNPEDSLIKIRWRIITRPGYLYFLFFFWKFRSTEYWKDGISTMHVNNQGKIHCHVCDNIDVEIDDIEAKQKQSIKNRLVNRGLNV